MLKSDLVLSLAAAALLACGLGATKVGGSEIECIIDGASDPTDGCSTPAWLKRVTYLPDFFYCPCVGHDVCYEICGFSKAKCDLLFLQHLVELCQLRMRSFVGQFACASSASMFYLAVAIRGFEAHRDSQKRSNCVASQ